MIFHARSSLSILLLVLPQIVFSGVFDWMFNNYEESTPKTSGLPNYIENSNDLAVSVKIPFEITTVDEKFIEELSRFSGQPLTELDKCNHKIILGLEATCEEMTEEELSKLSVNLFNCQASVENRQIYPCTKDMKIHECTREMDLNTWNAYHIISNRARAACYQLRQQQFKAKTELTVNHLMASAENQILTMNRLQESQDHLHDSTIKTMDDFASSHKNIVGQQQQLFSAQQAMSSYVSSNIRELARERSLIASGQRELSRITQSIKKKLDDAKNQLTVQDEGQRSAHEKILSELLMIQKSASKVWSQLDVSTGRIIETHQQTKAHFNQLMTDMQTMNSTVHHLMNIIHEMKRKLEDKFSWLSIIIGDTDETLQKVYGAVVHGTYLVVGMIAASFLQVPFLTRIVLVLIVPLNALSELHHGTSLHFVTLTAVLGAVMLCNLLCTSALKFYRWQRQEQPQPLAGPSSSIAFDFPESIRNETLEDDYERLNVTSSVNDGVNLLEYTPLDSAPRPPVIPRRHPLYGHTTDDYDAPQYTKSARRRISKVMDTSTTDMHVRPLDWSRSSTPLSERNSSKKLCSGQCKNGLPCRLVASGTSPFCHRHGGGSRENTPRS